MRAALLIAIVTVTASMVGCASILGISDVPTPLAPSGDAQPDNALPDDRTLPKGDGPTCRFDDDGGSLYDKGCTFGEP